MPKQEFEVIHQCRLPVDAGPSAAAHHVNVAGKALFSTEFMVEEKVASTTVDGKKVLGTTLKKAISTVVDGAKIPGPALDKLVRSGALRPKGAR